MNTSYSASLVSSRTRENIKENYRREVVASGKYAIYAKQLSEAGYESLANLFHACSHSECIHSIRHSRVALFLGIKLETEVVHCEKKDVSEILDEMIREELDAIKSYPRFVEEARHDANSSAILSMTAAMKADHSHYEYCQEAAVSDNYWLGEKRPFYVCALCGYIHQWNRVVCPVCGARPELFLPFHDKNFFDAESLTFTKHEKRDDFAVPDALDTWSFEHVYPTCLINAVEFTSEITDELNKRCWSERDVYAIVLSLTEAAVNANEHGNKRQDGKHVYVECCISSEFFFCTMEDEGDGFDPMIVPNPSLEENLLASHGRGLKLISSFMSRVWFNSKGNKIYMLKNR